VEATFSFVKDWYLGHIIRSDLDYVACLKGYHARASVQGILFHLDGVVCAIHEERFRDSAAPLCGKSAEELQALIESQPSLFLGLETGLLDSGEFLARFSELCGQEIPAAEFGLAYARVYSPLEPFLDLIRRLKPRYKLGLVADTAPLRVEQGLKELDILPLFDAVTLSYEVGAVSPDPGLWDDALAKLALLAEECIHVSSRPSHALAATGHLLHGIVGSSAAALQANLRRLKVEV
jgi:putative hydrolase of the HAD superfamily